MILVQTMIEINVDGKVTSSDGSHIPCKDIEQAKELVSRLNMALLVAEQEFFAQHPPDQPETSHE